MTPARNFFATWKLGALVMLAGVVLTVLYQAGDEIEAALLPVLGNNPCRGVEGCEPFTIERDGNTVTYSALIDKVRDCELDHFGWVVWTGDRRHKLTARNALGELPGDTPPASFEPGVFRIGPFRGDLPEGHGDADSIYGNLWYRCHSHWLVRARIGPIPVP